MDFYHFHTLVDHRSTLILWGFPPKRPVILHCTLLLKPAGQVKFAPSGAYLPGTGPQTGPKRPVRR